MRAAYDGIYLDLKGSIVDGTYRYKDYLPSEAVLVKRYGCAHNTVRKAIAILAREGLVQPVHGKGVRILYRSTPLLAEVKSKFEPDRTRLNGAEVGDADGNFSRTRVMQMETISADENFAKQTGFERGCSVLHLERLRYDKPLAVVRETNYFRSDIVVGLTRKDAEGSVYHFIEDVCGNKLTISKYVITVQPADDRDKKLLDLNGADYVACVTAVSYDSTGLIGEVTVMHYRPDYFSYTDTFLRTRIGHE